MIDFLQRLFFPLQEHTQKKRKITDIEKYIIDHNPQSLEDVERLSRQYQYQGTGNDRLFL